VETEFCKVARIFNGPSAWNFFHVTLVLPGILRRALNFFFNLCTSDVLIIRAISKKMLVIESCNFHKCNKKELVGAYSRLDLIGLILVAARHKAWVCGRSLAGITGLIPVGGTDVSLVSVIVR